MHSSFFLQLVNLGLEPAVGRMIEMAILYILTCWTILSQVALCPSVISPLNLFKPLPKLAQSGITVADWRCRKWHPVNYIGYRDTVAARALVGRIKAIRDIMTGLYVAIGAK